MLICASGLAANIRHNYRPRRPTEALDLTIGISFLSHRKFNAPSKPILRIQPVHRPSVALEVLLGGQYDAVSGHRERS